MNERLTGVFLFVINVDLRTAPVVIVESSTPLGGNLVKVFDKEGRRVIGALEPVDRCDLHYLIIRNRDGGAVSVADRRRIETVGIAVDVPALDNVLRSICFADCCCDRDLLASEGSGVGIALDAAYLTACFSLDDRAFGIEIGSADDTGAISFFVDTAVLGIDRDAVCRS